jgi:uncharacterized protein YjbI with pentapeptide repeats
MEILFHQGKLFKNITYSEKETLNREFEKCSFINCDFSNGVFSSSKFIDCVFSGCNLAMAKLGHCQLNNVTFKDCKLLGVNFSDCSDFLFSVKFDNCVLDYSSMKNMDFTESDLTKSHFINTDLLYTVFFRTILKEVDFLTALNYNIDPDVNIIKKAKFSLNAISGLLNKYDIIIE